MKSELQEYMKRPTLYENIDGTGEMSMGVMFLGYAILSYWQVLLPENSVWKNGIAPSSCFYSPSCCSSTS